MWQNVTVNVGADPEPEAKQQEGGLSLNFFLQI